MFFASQNANFKAILSDVKSQSYVPSKTVRLCSRIELKKRMTFLPRKIASKSLLKTVQIWQLAVRRVLVATQFYGYSRINVRT